MNCHLRDATIRQSSQQGVPLEKLTLLLLAARGERSDDEEDPGGCTNASSEHRTSAYGSRLTFTVQQMATASPLHTGR
jgi:hypothetical protein